MSEYQYYIVSGVAWFSFAPWNMEQMLDKIEMAKEDGFELVSIDQEALTAVMRKPK